MDLVHPIRRIRSHRLKVIVYSLYFAYCKATWRDRPLPEFLVIGAQKSGTGSLHKYLHQHPQLFPSPLKKEIHFFSTMKLGKPDNFEKGETWYRAHFPRQREMGLNSKVFESTPDYLFHPLVPERIFNLAPEMKLIVLLRNPSERAISQYFMEKAKNREPLRMLDAFQQEEKRLKDAILARDYKNRSFIYYAYKSRGRYAEQLERYLNFFPLSQILLLCSEDLFTDPYGSLRKVFDFVGVDDNFKIKDVDPWNVSKNKSEVSPDVRAYLDEYFLPYNQALNHLVGEKFCW
jgi:hypothetical protein